MMTLKQAAAYHVGALRGAKRSEDTIGQYSIVHRQFIAYVERLGAPATVEHLTIEHARGYLAEVAQRCNVNTVRSYVIALRSWAGLLASDLGIFPDGSPLANLPRPRVSKTIPATLNRQQFDLLVAVCTQTRDPLRNAAILKLMVESGLRNNELCELQLADVEFATTGTAGRVLVRVGKGRKQRYVGFGLEASRALALYLKQERAREDHNRGSTAPWLFSTHFGEQITPSAVRKLVHELCTKAGLSGAIHPHSLRHTFATWRAKAGMNAFALQAQMGHATLEQTNHYVQLAQSDVQDTYMSMLDAAKPQIRPLGRHCSTCTCQAPTARQAS